MKTPLRTSRHAKAFTLVELLTVITIIGILAGLVLGTLTFVQEKAARSRAEAEIKAMEAALESYKADNGDYPNNGTGAGTTQNLNAATIGNPSSYKAQSLILYRAISGDTNLDRQVTSADGGTDIFGAAVTPASTIAPKTYFEFKPNQLELSAPSETVTAIIDPWGFSYGYSTIYRANPAKGFNPTFDLWSTAGGTGAKTGETEDQYRLRWVKNW